LVYLKIVSRSCTRKGIDVLVLPGEVELRALLVLLLKPEALAETEVDAVVAKVAVVEATLVEPVEVLVGRVDTVLLIGNISL
jgi:hypothetical protein